MTRDGDYGARALKKDFKQGVIGLSIYEDEKMKLARMATSEIAGSKWPIFMHYLIGKNGKIKYIREVHQMLVADYEDYIHAFASAQFKSVRFLEENLWNHCRGLFIASK